MTSENEPSLSEWTVLMDGLVSHNDPPAERNCLAGVWPAAYGLALTQQAIHGVYQLVLGAGSVAERAKPKR